MGRLKSAFDRLWEALREAMGQQQQDDTRLSEEDYAKQRQLAQELDRMEYEYQKENGYLAPDFEREVPDTLGLEPRTYEARSEEELQQQGREQLAASDVEARTELEQKLQNALQKADAAQENADRELERDLAAGRERARQQLEQNKNAMIRQGLVDSSIASNGADAVRTNARDLAQQALNAYDAELAGLRAQRELADSQYRTALKNYELKYAEKLSALVDKLQRQELEKQQEVNDYNAGIAAREAEYQKQRTQRIAQMEEQFRQSLQQRLQREAEEEARVGYSPEKDAEMKARFELVKASYDAMDRARARKLIDENAEYLANKLGKYYAQLVEAYRET